MNDNNLLEENNIRVIYNGVDINSTRVVLQNVFEKLGIQFVQKHESESEYELYFKYNNQYDEDDEFPDRMCITNTSDGECNLSITLDSIKVNMEKIQVIEELLDEINHFLIFGTYDVDYIEDDYYEIHHCYELGEETNDPNCVESVIHEIIRNHRLFVPLIFETIRRDNVFKIVCNDIMKRSCV